MGGKSGEHNNGSEQKNSSTNDTLKGKVEQIIQKGREVKENYDTYKSDNSDIPNTSSDIEKTSQNRQNALDTAGTALMMSGNPAAMGVGVALKAGAKAYGTLRSGMGKAAASSAKELNTAMTKDQQALRTAENAMQGAGNFGQNVVNNLGDVAQVRAGMSIPQQQATNKIDYKEILNRYLGGRA